MTIHLTDVQQQVLQANQGEPLEVIDPATGRQYMLLAREQYERVRQLLEPGDSSTAITSAIPPGVLRSQQAFWRDLPGLVAQTRLRGHWVLYHGDERIGMAQDANELIRECVRRQLPDDCCFLATILPRRLAPWEIEDVEAPEHACGPAELQRNPTLVSST